MSDLKAINTFTKGIVTDTNELVATPDTYRSALNMLPAVNEGKDGFLEYVGAKTGVTTTFVRENGSTWTIGAGQNEFAAPAFDQIIFKIKDEVTEDFYLLYKQPSFDFLILIRARGTQIKQLLKTAIPTGIGTFDMLTSNAKLVDRKHIFFLFQDVQYHIPLFLLPSAREIPIVTTHIFPQRQEQLNGSTLTNTITVRNLINGVVATVNVTTTTTTKDAILQDVFTAVNGLALADFTITLVKDNYVKCEGPYYFDVTIGAIDAKAFDSIEMDSYDIRSILLSDITLIKKTPFAHPYAEAKTIVDNNPNRRLLEIAPQFAYRYRYLDGSVSTWSALSPCLNPSIVLTGQAPLYYAAHNVIVLSVNDKEANSMPKHAFIVEFAVKPEISSFYLSLGEFFIHELGTYGGNAAQFALFPKPFITFDGNARSLNAVASDVDTKDTQVLLPHSYVPIASKALGTSSANNSSSILLLGNNTEEYPNIEISNFTATVIKREIFENPDVYSRVVVSNFSPTYHFGGVYKFAIQYSDDYDRRVCQLIARVQVPGLEGKGLTRNDIRLSTTQRPPSWAKKWSILRTENLKHTRFNVVSALGHNSIGIAEVNLAEMKSTSGVIRLTDITTWNGTKNALYIAVNNSLLGESFDDDIDPYPLTGPNIKINDFKNSRKGGLLNSDGMKAIIHGIKKNGDEFIPFTSNLEFNVEGYSILNLGELTASNDDVKMFIVCSGLTEDMYNSIFDAFDADNDVELVYEIFVTSDSSQELFYEIGESGRVSQIGGLMCHIDANVDNQSDTLTNFSHRLERGDVFLTNPSLRTDIDGALFQDENSIYYAPSPISLTYKQFTDLGRLNAPRIFNIESSVESTIRYSGVLSDTSSIHRLNMFLPTDYININNEIGTIVALPSVRNNVLAVCQIGVQPIYVNISELTDLKGSTTLFRSDRVLTIANEVLKQYGALSPSLVVQHEGMVYAYDSVKRIPWRFGQDGLVPWGEMGNRTYFKKGLHQLDVKCLLTSDIRNAIFYCSDDLDAFVFDNKDNTFRGKVYNAPLLNYELADKSLFLGTNQVYNVLQKSGMLSAWELSLIVNLEPTIVKELENITIVGRAKPFTTVEVGPSLENVLGYETYMHTDQYVTYQGNTSVQVLRDVNDQNPDLLIGVPGGDIPAAVTARRLNGRPVIGRAHLVSFFVAPENLTNFVSQSVVYADELQVVETKIKRV
jgi:hypothetical protein